MAGTWGPGCATARREQQVAADKKSRDVSMRPPRALFRIVDSPADLPEHRPLSPC
ncbi:MAG TPA: hypothetical protein PLJ27_12520 [Polyangiaceae bacterium]|nr:hypothetical protein [Polyangiaceae bacterium]HPY17231.1 hypothetical protein [Polyangiaceae bacterium]HQB45795.1 hypothetical protein [Polyangiaceae bacterium]HQF26831.1 hypothetical protein [Polyangiaceae bacterium]HQK18278.1 hypothetical protein [Polyangiaceae bacterium]